MNAVSKSIIALFILTVFASCSKDFQRHIRGNGNIITVTRSLSNFEIVNSSGTFDVEIINDPGSSRVEIEAESNIIDILTTEVTGNQLEIGFEERVRVSTHKAIRVKVFTKSLSAISLSGSGNINSGAFTGNDFEATLSGSGNISFDFSGINATYSISGSGRITGRGKVISQDIKVSGSGDIDAPDLESENTDIHINGSADARIFSTKTLKATISGSGSVGYKGFPVLDYEVSGSGKVFHIN